MIKNERQYRITKSEAQRFEATLLEMGHKERPPDVPALLYTAQIEALKGQLDELRSDLLEYEQLRAGQCDIADPHSVEDIPDVLVKTRIKLGLSQEQLAEKMQLKPQQVQRYEATGYKSASLSRVADVAEALGVRFSAEVMIPGRFELSSMLAKLEKAGLPAAFVTKRLLPKAPGVLFADDDDAGNAESIALEAAEGLSRIYGWSPAAVFGNASLSIVGTPAATARFKLPIRVNTSGLAAYIVYAHYLALITLEATQELEVTTTPTDPLQVRGEILTQYGELNFETALKYVWSLGIPVLTLNDPGAFHGACWRISGRNVIVLKQRTRSAARWIHDLFHEYFHAASNPDLEEHTVIEENEMSVERRNSPEEQAASQFAGDVMLQGRAEELAEFCVNAATGSVERLKWAVAAVARREGVSAGALANYMAFRLSLQGLNWWGSATNLQEDLANMQRTPRDFLMQHADLVRLNNVDRGLLLRAMEPQVLAFSGKIASGKSLLSTEVAKALHWKRASFGDYLRAAARREGLEESRETLQELGEALVEKDAEAFCRSVLAYSQWQFGEPLIIDGVRHQQVVASLRKIIAPLELRLVFLEIDEEARLARLRSREESTEKRLESIEAHSTEEQVKTLLPNEADLKLSAERPVDELVRTVVTWVHEGEIKNAFCAA